jgi:hypothetical protein
VLVNMGFQWLALGGMERAREAIRASLQLCCEMGMRYPEGYALCGLAVLADEQGDCSAALELASQSLALRREIGHGDGVADSLLLQGEIHWRAGKSAEAKSAATEALALLREQGRALELCQAHAFLAILPEGAAEAAEAALEDAGESGNTPKTRFYLWKATGKRKHLAEAKRLLDFRVEHTPEEYREPMLRNVRVNREILAAWAEHGGGERPADSSAERR